MPTMRQVRPDISLRQSESFWDKVDLLATNGCWIWTGSRNPHGYGQLNVGGRQGKVRRAHVVAYELLVGMVDETLELDHLCQKPACVNPLHLEPVSHAENGRRARRMKPGDSHCIYGHEMTDENTGWSDNGPGTPKFRRCRTCNRKRNRDGRRAQPRISGFNRKEAS